MRRPWQLRDRLSTPWFDAKSAFDACVAAVDNGRLREPKVLPAAHPAYFTDPRLRTRI